MLSENREKEPSPASPTEKTSPSSSFPSTAGPDGAPLARSYADTLREGAPNRKPQFLNLEFPKIGNLSSCNGAKMAVFSEEEVSQLSVPFQHTLVGKFSFGRPPLASIKQHFLSLECFSVRIQLLNQRHVLIFLNNADDFAKLWLRREVFIDSLPMRLFKWSPSFNVKHEPSVAPLWVRISGLPIHLFDKCALFTIDGLIGEPFKIDEATCNLSRINYARVCIEIDLKHQPPSEIRVMNAGELLSVLVVYERLPKYCSYCHHLGHEENACYIKQAGPRPRRNLRKQPDIHSKGKEKVTEVEPKDFTIAGPSRIRTEDKFEPPILSGVSLHNTFDALAIVPHVKTVNELNSDEGDENAASEMKSESNEAETDD
ncbi:hypothetical protein CDL12_19422 [Handroanthus impetiginosus]|uniref:DUF4283 domain-containing protein n=1 Tax=Handroanthus impetiginosus TaxID=429701 RepID=A0A2G9GRS6_9LAMI|nr:hypothetical protein CDL12_19422 [Handroanthus impetiginosus]